MTLKHAFKDKKTMHDSHREPEATKNKSPEKLRESAKRYVSYLTWVALRWLNSIMSSKMHVVGGRYVCYHTLSTNHLAYVSASSLPQENDAPNKIIFWETNSLHACIWVGSWDNSLRCLFSRCCSFSVNDCPLCVQRWACPWTAEEAILGVHWLNYIIRMSTCITEVFDKWWRKGDIKCIWRQETETMLLPRNPRLKVMSNTENLKTQQPSSWLNLCFFLYVSFPGKHGSCPSFLLRWPT